jgi:hypothetical protein
MKIGSTSMLRLMFILGAIVDGAIAVSWFLIASGTRIPNILNGYTGAGVERRGLLLITSALLFLSVIIEFVFYGDILGGAGFIFGVTKRILLSTLATAVYFYSFSNLNSPHST